MEKAHWEAKLGLQLEFSKSKKTIKEVFSFFLREETTKLQFLWALWNSNWNSNCNSNWTPTVEICRTELQLRKPAERRTEGQIEWEQRHALRVARAARSPWPRASTYLLNFLSCALNAFVFWQSYKEKLPTILQSYKENPLPTNNFSYNPTKRSPFLQNTFPTTFVGKEFSL